MWRDNSGIKSGDDWRRGIVDDLKDSDWVLSFLSRHSRRDPGLRLDRLGILRFTGKARRLQPCSSKARQGAVAYVLRGSLAIICSRGCAAQWCAGRRIAEASRHGGGRVPRHARAGPQAPLAISGVRTRKSSPALLAGTVTRSPQPRRIVLVEGLAAGIGCGHSLSQGCAGQGVHLSARPSGGGSSRRASLASSPASLREKAR